MIKKNFSDTDTMTGEVIEKFPGVDLGWDYNPGMAWAAPDIALGRELVKLPPVVRKASISAVNTKLQEQVPSYRAWLANMATQTPEYAARSRFVVGHIPTEAISALYKANIAVPNSVVLLSGAIAQQLRATMPNAMQDLMALLAKANQAKYDSGAGVLTVQSGERKLRLVWIAGLLQLLGLI